MSHLFITHAPPDSTHRNTLIDTLQQGGFTEIHHTTESWSPVPEDTTVLLLILTPDALNHQPVTYQWAWALGNNMPVIPFLFSGDESTIPPPLQDLTLIDCRQGIPATLIETITSLSITPPEITYLHTTIMQALLRARIVIATTLWFSRFTEPDNTRLAQHITLLREECRIVTTESIPEIILQRAPIFTKQQLNTCRTLIRHLQTFTTLIDNKTNLTDAITYWENDLNPLIATFDTPTPQLDKFKAYDKFLGFLLRGKVRQYTFGVQPTEIIDWIFPDDPTGKFLHDTLTQVEAFNKSNQNT